MESIGHDLLGKTDGDSRLVIVVGLGQKLSGRVGNPITTHACRHDSVGVPIHDGKQRIVSIGVRSG